MSKTLRLELFWTRDAINKSPAGVPAADVARNYISNSRGCLKRHGFEVKTTPESSDPVESRILGWPCTVNLPEHDAHIRRMAQNAAPNMTGVPVIFATLNEASRVELPKDGKVLEVLGWVPDEPVVMKDWPQNFVLINMMRYTTLGYPVAHELGHAAGLDHVNDMSNVMFFGPFFGTNKFTPEQVETIGKAYFVENH